MTTRMISKRSLIVALIGLNLLFLAALVFTRYSPSAAYAQPIPTAGNYLSVTCEAVSNYDVLYVVDLTERALHAFVPSRKLDGTIEYVGSRDLQKDFGRQSTSK